MISYRTPQEYLDESDVDELAIVKMVYREALVTM